MEGKMKVAVMTAAKKMQWIEKDIPEARQGELLVKLEYVGVCGSDLHFYQDGRLGNWIPHGPLTLGHEPGGVVVEVGEGVTGFQAGDKVAIEPGVPCGSCDMCKKGKYNLCGRMSFMAIPGEREGVFSEYCAHPATMCYKLPENVSTLEGALCEPLAVGLHAVGESGAKIGQNAIILGSGCIGLVTLMVLKAVGVKEVYVADIIDKRLAKAAELGAAKTIRSDQQDLLAFAASLPDGGADLVFETAGNKQTMLLTSKLIKKGGTVTLVGMAPTAEMTYDIGSLMDKEAVIHTVFRYRNLYPTAIKAVSEGTIPLKSIVSHVFEFKDVIEGVAYNVDNKQDVIKAVVRF